MNNYETPLVSVIMPAYNVEQYIENAIESILQQTYTNFELIILNDGSTDNTLNIINRINDSRIKVINNDRNLGLISTLNKGILSAKGKYIARMDSDDYCYNERISIQVKILEANPDIFILGGGHSIIDEKGCFLINQYFPLSYNTIKAEALFNSPFSHITIMLRRSYLVEKDLFYPSESIGAEDYALWLDIIEKKKGRNLPYILADYRLNLSGQTSKFSKIGTERFNIISRIQKKALANIGLILDAKSALLHYNLSLSDRIKNLEMDNEMIKDVIKHFNNIINHNKNTEFCSTSALRMILGKIWVKTFVINFRRLNYKQKICFLLNKLFWYGAVYFIMLKLRYDCKNFFNYFF